MERIVQFKLIVVFIINNKHHNNNDNNNNDNNNFFFFFFFFFFFRFKYFNLYRFVHCQFGSARVSLRRWRSSIVSCSVNADVSLIAFTTHSTSSTDATVMHYESFLAEVRSDKQLVPLKVQTRELQTVQFVTNGKGSHLLLAVARTYVHLYQIYHRTVRPGDAKITAQPALRQIVARSPLWFAWDVRNSMLAFVVAQPKANARKKEPSASCVLQLVYFTERARNASYPLDLDFQIDDTSRPTEADSLSRSQEPMLSLVHLPDHGLCLCAQRHEPIAKRQRCAAAIARHALRAASSLSLHAAAGAAADGAVQALGVGGARAARSRSASRRARCSLTACCRWRSLRL
jgi:hypothetical protein